MTDKPDIGSETPPVLVSHVADQKAHSTGGMIP
jgi:hypothetical protein